MTENKRPPYPQPLETLALEVDALALVVAKRHVEYRRSHIMTEEEEVAALAADIAATLLFTHGHEEVTRNFREQGNN